MGHPHRACGSKVPLFEPGRSISGWESACGSEVRLFRARLYPRAKDHPMDEDLSMGTPIARGFHLASLARG